MPLHLLRSLPPRRRGPLHHLDDVGHLRPTVVVLLFGAGKCRCAGSALHAHLQCRSSPCSARPAVQAERRHFALSCLDHRITELFYWFAVFNTFLGVVFGGSLFQQLGAIIKNPGEQAGAPRRG